MFSHDLFRWRETVAWHLSPPLKPVLLCELRTQTCYLGMSYSVTHCKSFLILISCKRPIIIVKSCERKKECGHGRSIKSTSQDAELYRMKVLWTLHNRFWDTVPLGWYMYSLKTGFFCLGHKKILNFSGWLVIRFFIYRHL